MPGAVAMNGNRGDPHTNHDRERATNGSIGENGLDRSGDGSCDRNGRGKEEGYNSVVSLQNGHHEQTIPPSSPSKTSSISRNPASGGREPPPEISHITEGFESLPRLLKRLAQVTHNQLAKQIQELAQIQMPIANGDGPHFTTHDRDAVTEDTRKRVKLLKFAEATHASWTKALVITHWSRVSDDVGRLIDLRLHIDRQKEHYDWAVHVLSEAKRDLVHARVPNPDLKTAVEILSTGTASWMSDLGYAQPEPLSAKAILKSLDELNTLLSIRLNLHAYDGLPQQLKDFTIHSGRVTFRVAGEFEIDLTIADDKPESQFWFIDLRVAFEPAIKVLPDNMRYQIEDKVNNLLGADGLQGCYKFIHEFVLTQKIGELRRQAAEMSRGRWIDTIRVEPLHRALSLQYWLENHGKDGPKSWIIVGIDSGASKSSESRKYQSSRITIRWYRDGREIKDIQITTNLRNLSAENLLQDTINRHSYYILHSIYRKLREKPLYAKRQLAISLRRAAAHTTGPELVMQLTCIQRITISIEPVTGRFAVSPGSRAGALAEWNMNHKTQDPAAKAFEYVEHLRCAVASEEVVARSRSVGWTPTKNPGLAQDDLKPIFPRDSVQLSWFDLPGWIGGWFLIMTSSMSGERWWLIETTNVSTLRIRNSFQVPIPIPVRIFDHEFMSKLHVFAAALVTYYTNLRSLHSRKTTYRITERSVSPTSLPFKVPVLLIKLSEMNEARKISARSGRPWAKDCLKMSFHGLTPQQSNELALFTRGPTPTRDRSDHFTGEVTGPSMKEHVIVTAEITMTTPLPSSLDLVRQQVDPDIAFHASSGAVMVRVYAPVGQSVILPINERLLHVEQLVDFIAVAKKHSETLHCDSMSLSKVVLSYGDDDDAAGAGEVDTLHDIPLSSRHKATIEFGGKSTNMLLSFEPGNPHVRLQDDLTKVLNSDVGLDGFASALPLTLPLLRAFDSIEDSWSGAFESGNAQVMVRSLDWYSIRYAILPHTAPVNSPLMESQPRRINIDVRLQHRKSEPWWCVRRMFDRGAASPAGDDIDAVLKTVWDANNDLDADTGWVGMHTSAIAKPAGVEMLLSSVDHVIKNLAMLSATISKGPGTESIETQPQQSSIGSIPTKANHHQASTPQDISSGSAAHPRPQSTSVNQAYNRQAAQQRFLQHQQQQQQQQAHIKDEDQHEMIVID